MKKNSEVINKNLIDFSTFTDLSPHYYFSQLTHQLWADCVIGVSPLPPPALRHRPQNHSLEGIPTIWTWRENSTKKKESMETNICFSPKFCMICVNPWWGNYIPSWGWYCQTDGISDIGNMGKLYDYTEFTYSESEFCYLTVCTII